MSSEETGAEAKADALQGTSCSSRLFFQFMNPIISMARKDSNLEADAVPMHTMNLETRHLYEVFETARTKTTGTSSNTGSLLPALLAGRRGVLVLTAAGYLLTQAVGLSGPLLLREIVLGLTCREKLRQGGTSECSGGEGRLYLCVKLLQNHRLECFELTPERLPTLTDNINVHSADIFSFFR